MSDVIVGLDVESTVMASNVLVYLQESSLENKGTRLANVILASGAPVEKFVILQIFLFTKVTLGISVIFLNSPNVTR